MDCLINPRCGAINFYQSC